MCATIRRTARALTQLYDDALRPSGLRATQFTLLQALSFTGEISQGGLGEILAIDSTTLTRTLRIMRRHGWIEERRGGDRRERLLRLAKPGRRQLDRALPIWKVLQSRLRHAFGHAPWSKLLGGSSKLANVAARRPMTKRRIS